MKKIYTLTFLITSFVCQAQIVNIPDANFKNALVNDIVVDIDNNGVYDSDADLNNDGEIQVSEAESVISLNISFKNITSLEGIASFSNLIKLYCTDNPFIEFDVSSLINLETLRCWDIDQVVSIDLSSNINLTSLECDVNDSLEFLNIQNGNNQNLVRLWTDSSPNLVCIQVDDEVYANNQTCNNNEWCKDISTTYNENCTLGINEFNYNAINVFPNPTKNELTINSNLSVESFKIYSTNGKLVMSKKLQNNKIDLFNLNSGIYFIKFQSQNKTIIKKIIKE
ncbi:hypothetical protein IMCC3317_42000 [Kordia antarctica]|uniref:Secretion system C-terminal sorting domain-containing protein n=1 Tax=Kordia antarctica TaxID=1218801 RepID=A0A7L4ZQL3_9FLAO|nr:T9SS type A sorting domain-containing protein [Kordia antarctica]QHI38800.1 hypothetical protein IMCC3317_42000 [Kordia antarctica]